MKFRTFGFRPDGQWGCDECCDGKHCDDKRHSAQVDCRACTGSGVLDVDRIDFERSVKCPKRIVPPCNITCWHEADESRKCERVYGHGGEHLSQGQFFGGTP